MVTIAIAAVSVVPTYFPIMTVMIVFQIQAFNVVFKILHATIPAEDLAEKIIKLPLLI